MTHIRLLDHQTLVMVLNHPHAVELDGADPERDAAVAKHLRKLPDDEIVMFATLTLVDPAGNRLHSDSEIPFAADQIPPQPAP